MPPARILMLKTCYPHWGAHTAFNAFLPYFDAQKYRLTLRNIPMRGERIEQTRWWQTFFQRGMQAYGWRDFTAEVSAFFAALAGSVDVIHLLDGEHGLSFLPQWLRIPRSIRRSRRLPKLVASFHQPPALLEQLINPQIVCQLDMALVVSPDQADFFKQFMPPEKVKTILLGVDTRYYVPDPEKRQPGAFKCLSGGVWLRDYPALYQTAARLIDHPDIEFHIVAPRAANAPALPNLRYHTNIPDAELLDLYQTCDLLFLPLQSATANTFLLEGCACGLPLLTSDLPSTPAYFPGPEARPVMDNDPAEFARLILEIKDKPARRSLMAQNARRRAKELSWQRIVKEYEKTYDLLLNRAVPPNHILPTIISSGLKARPAPPETVLFLHIPKCAGTTLVDEIIRREFSPHELLLFYNGGTRDLLAQLQSMPEEELRAIYCLAGHFAFGVHVHLPQPSTYITLLRDPFQRIRSHYHFIQRRDDHPLHAKVIAGKISLIDYVEKLGNLEMDNGQTRLLAGIGYSAPFGKCTPEMLQRAKDNLRQHFCITGVTERFDEFLQVAHARLGWQIASYRRRNVDHPSRQTIDFTPEERETILHFNTLDIELYQFASQLFEEQYRRLVISS